MGGAQPRRSRPMVDSRKEKTACGRYTKNLRCRTPEALPADGLSQASGVLAGAGLPDRRWMSSNELKISFL